MGFLWLKFCSISADKYTKGKNDADNREKGGGKTKNNPIAHRSLCKKSGRMPG